MSSPRQVLAPDPALVIRTWYCVLESRWVRGTGVQGVVSRRLIGATTSSAIAGADAEPELGGTRDSEVSTIGASPGTRSWSSRSTARTIGSAWNRSGITSASRVLVSPTRLIPWWWAMYDRTTTDRLPLGRRSGV